MLLVFPAARAPRAQSQATPSSTAKAPAPSAQDALSSPPAVKPEPKKAKEAYKRGLRAEQAQDWQTAHDNYADAVDWAPSEHEYFLRREVAKSHLVQAKVDSAERDAVSGRLKDARKEGYINAADWRRLTRALNHYAHSSNKAQGTA